MRDYGVVSPKFWIGETGKALRGHPEAQLVALYLMTCPHANMIGVFHCPLVYIAHETGLSFEGASKALARLSEAQFCTYEDASETVFVHRMAAYQVGESLKPEDNRVKSVTKEWLAIGHRGLQQAFAAIYSIAFHLPAEGKKASPSEAPCKPLRSQEQEQEQEQDKNSVAKGDLPTCKAQAMVDLYHEVLPELPAVRLMSEARKKALSKFWRWVLTSAKPDGARRATTADEALAWLREYFDRARDNDFLMGRTGRVGDHANWQCDLDFLLTEKGMKHVIEKTRETA